jgi:phospholipid/cholesterol/gamma-HCH transport system substrate-binding protein
MNFKFKHTDRIVGLFILISLFLFFLSIFLIVFNQNIFTKKIYFKTQFQDADGLKINKDIMFKGFKIGRIKNFNLNNDNLVNVDFYIYSKYKDKVKLHSVINKSSNPLTGSTILLLPSIKTNEIEKEHSFIPSMDSKEGQMLAALGEIEKKADSITNIINNIDTFLASLNKDNNASDNSIARILVNSADIVESIRGQMNTINGIFANLKVLSNNIKNPDGLAQRILDPGSDSIKNSLDNLEIIMQELSTFSKFLNSQSDQIESILVEGKNTMQDAQDVIESIKSNPLIRGGLPSNKKDTTTIKESIRDRDF